MQREKKQKKIKNHGKYKRITELIVKIRDTVWTINISPLSDVSPQEGTRAIVKEVRTHVTENISVFKKMLNHSFSVFTSVWYIYKNMGKKWTQYKEPNLQKETRRCELGTTEMQSIKTITITTQKNFFTVKYSTYQKKTRQACLSKSKINVKNNKPAQQKTCAVFSNWPTEKKFSRFLSKIKKKRKAPTYLDTIDYLDKCTFLLIVKKV